MPLTVRVKVAPPAVALVGEMEVMLGLRLSMVKVVAFDVPPPGVWVTTVTGTVPAAARSAAETDAVSLALLTKVVASGAPFQFMADAVFTKFEPFTVSVKVALPTVLLTGEMVVTAGTGLSMVKVCAFDAPPPGDGFETVTFTVPAVAMSVESIAAVTCAAFTKVVVRGEPPQRTVAPFTKLPPLTVSVKPEPPATALAGESDDAEGRGLSTLKVAEFDAALPVLITVTRLAPAAVRSPVGTVAVSSMSLTNVVARSAPFHCTIEPELKAEPFTVSVNDELPSGVLDGEMDVTPGMGVTDATLVLHMLRP